MIPFRSVGSSSGIVRANQAGDLILLPVNLQYFTNGTSVDDEITMPAEGLLSGVVNFVGSGGFSVHFPSTLDIYNAITAGGQAPDISENFGFSVNLMNNSGDEITFKDSVDASFEFGSFSVASGKGVEVLVQFGVIQQPTSLIVDLEENSDIATIKFTGVGQNSLPMGSSVFSVNLSPGASILPVEDYFPNTGQFVTELFYGTSGLAAFRLSISASATGTIGMTFATKMKGSSMKIFDLPVIS